MTASSVRKTFTSRLDLWANPLLDRATSGDDFDLRDLRRKPTSVYVAVNLLPGKYLLICFLPDATDGKPHAAHGMVQPFDVA